jgi:mannose-1-phosphate guanylyltransferase
VGWSDIGTWPALLEVLGAAGLAGSVIEAGDTTAGHAGDLLVERRRGALGIVDVGEGTIVAEQPAALLRGARAARPVVQALLDRCAAAEARA